MRYDVVVVGGGPAGMMAAISAAERGCKTAIIDKNSRLGKKLLITGKGRCNLTNDCSRDEFFANVAVNSKFLFSCFSKFNSQDVMGFFENLNVPLKVERGRRVFPVSDRAADVSNALQRCCRDNNVCVISDKVSGVICTDGKIDGIKLSSGAALECAACVIATGGMSYQSTGSTGDGYKFARSCGHNVIKPKPSLVPLVIEGDDCRDAQGLSLKNISITVREAESGKVVYTDFGEMLFTHFGMSGPVILSASSHIRDTSKRHTITIDLKPALSEQQLDARLQRDFKENINKNFGNYLSKLLPQRLISVIIKRTDIPYDTKINSIRREQRLALVGLLKNLQFNIAGFRPIEEAIITSGGVDTAQINPGTMESKLIRGLYFAGEVIDVDAHTGGYNLQIAFCTGRCAGISAAERVRNYD